MSQKPFTNSFAEQCSLIDPDKPVRVYRNLNAKHNGKKGFFSVKQGSTVRFHTEVIFLKNVTFEVNERLRRQVIETKRKNVHAFVKGTIKQTSDYLKDGVWTWYNPYNASTFVCTPNAPIYQAYECTLYKWETKMLIAVDKTSAFYAKIFNSPLDIQQSCDKMYERVETCLL
jgi:hypothetical protein